MKKIGEHLLISAVASLVKRQKKEVIMNIKKFLMLTSITVQFSTFMYADQSKFNAAFIALTGIADSKNAANSVIQNSKSSTEAYNKLNSLKTQEASATAAFVSKTNKSSFKSTFTDSDVQKALRIAQGLEADPAASSTQLGDAIPANWATALNAFGGAQGVFDKTTTKKTVVSSGLVASSAAYKDAQVIEKYLASAQAKGIYSDLNSVDGTNLDGAFTAANVSRGTLPPVNPDADSKAAALKAEIQSSITTYNQYASTAGKAALPVIA